MSIDTERRTADEDDRARREARALADPTRRRVLRAVLDARRPIPIAELVELFELHHTAIRAHLDVLAEAGLVTATSAHNGGRGRPRLEFEPTLRADAALQPAGSYRELAGMLVEAVRTGQGSRNTGRRIGERVGAAHRGEDAVDVIVDEASRLGFEPALPTRARRQIDVVLKHCPFRDVAAEDPATVCQLHIGLAEGVAAALGGVHVEGMDVRDPYRAGCRLMLRRDGLPPAGEPTITRRRGARTSPVWDAR